MNITLPHFLPFKSKISENSQLCAFGVSIIITFLMLFPLISIIQTKEFKIGFIILTSSFTCLVLLNIYKIYSESDSKNHIPMDLAICNSISLFTTFYLSLNVIFYENFKFIDTYQISFLVGSLIINSYIFFKIRVEYKTKLLKYIESLFD